MIWLCLDLPLSHFEGALVTSEGSAVLALLILGVLWLVAQHIVKSDRVDMELLCGAPGVYLQLGVFWAETCDIISIADGTVNLAPIATCSHILQSVSNARSA